MTTVNDPNVSYAIGTAVWVKIYNRIWWPGIVVDETSIPDDLKAFKEGLKKSIAVVKFINEEKYEVVQAKDKILLYSCDKKTEFIEKGISLSKMQKKGQKIVGNCNMDNFFEDIRSMESYIEDGDINIIENLEIQHLEQEERRKSVKELFTPSSSKKPKKKVEGKKSLSAPKPKSTTSSKIIEKPSKTFKLEPKSSRRSKSIISKKSTPIQTFKNSGTPSGIFTCYSKVGCNYTTKSFDILKRHMLIHDKNTEEKAKKKPSPKSKKRKNLKTKSPDTKKQKLQEELLKDWNDGDDDDVVFVSSNIVPTTVRATNEVTINNVLPNVCKPSTSAMKEFNISSSDNNAISSISVCPTNVVKTTRKVLKDDIVPELHKSNIANTNSSDKIFEFNEIDCKPPVTEAEVILINSDSDSNTEDEINDTSEHQLTSEFINNTIFKVMPKKPVLVEIKTESKELKNEIDDQTKSTELLLENTNNTLDHISKLEESLSGISTSVNSVIDTHQKTDDIENQNVCIENGEMVESEKTANDLVIIDTDIIPNENVSKSSNFDTSDEVIIDSDDWIKQHGWETFPAEEIKQAKYFYNFTVTKRLPNISNLKPFGPELWSSPEFTFKKYINEETLRCFPRVIKIRMPKLEKDTLENIKNDPNFKALLKASAEGKTLTLEYTGANPIVTVASYDKLLARLPPEMRQSEVKQPVPEEIIDLDSSI